MRDVCFGWDNRVGQGAFFFHAPAVRFKLWTQQQKTDGGSRHRATMWPTRMFRLHLYCLGHYRTWAGQRQLQQAQAISIDRTTKTDTIQIVLCSMIDQGLAMPTPVQHQFNTISTPVRILLLWSTFDRRWFINRLVKMHAWRILHCHLCCRLVLST